MAVAEACQRRSRVERGAKYARGKMVCEGTGASLRIQGEVKGAGALKLREHDVRRRGIAWTAGLKQVRRKIARVVRARTPCSTSEHDVRCRGRLKTRCSRTR